jgi:ammonium transporter Rh
MCISGNLNKDADCHRLSFVWIAAVCEIIFVVLFGAFADYGVEGRASNTGSENTMDKFYPLYQDVHVMIFIGFGFLMTFLNKYGFSSVGYNFLIAAFTIQWSILVHGLFHGALHVDGDTGAAAPFELSCFLPQASAEEIENSQPTRWCIQLGIETLIKADFAAGAVLITFGAVLGKTNPVQMLLVALFEIIVYTLNEEIGAVMFGAVDMGGSIFVHTFGAYFGLALSFVISSAKNGDKCCDGEAVTRKENSSSYNSDLFAMIGTLFLWMFWPSFNGALAETAQQHRVVINTVLALAACCVTAFAVDNLLRPHHKFDMVSIQNATLAGGVAVGSSSDLIIQPWGALTIGIVAGALSVVGYVYIQPALAKCMGLDDTCGVHNLHGMPGVMGALGGAISAGVAGSSAYGESIASVFPARRECSPPDITYLCGRDAGTQAGFQLAALGVTILFSIVGGIICGLIIKMPCFLYHGPLKGEKTAAIAHPCCNWCHSNDERIWYDDSYYWNLEGEEEEEEEHAAKQEADEEQAKSAAGGEVEMTTLGE